MSNWRDPDILPTGYELDPDDPLFDDNADLDGDGLANQPDLGILLANYEASLPEMLSGGDNDGDAVGGIDIVSNFPTLPTSAGPLAVVPAHSVRRESTTRLLESLSGKIQEEIRRELRLRQRPRSLGNHPETIPEVDTYVHSSGDDLQLPSTRTAPLSLTQ